MDTKTSDAEAATYMAVTGVGLGLMMQVFVVAVQNVVPFRAIGSATALTQFSRSIGSTLGVTLMGVIINHGLPSGAAVEEASVRRLPPSLREALAAAMQPAFMAAAGVALVIFLIVLFGLREVPLREGFDEDAAAAVPESKTPTVVRSET
jgi:sugar phosphate permease